MTLVKVCGITNLDDALSAVAAGVDALGFNFYRLSTRYLSPANARDIISQLPERVLKIGVFVNEEIESVLRIAQEVSLSAVQLHGDESPEYWAGTRQPERSAATGEALATRNSGTGPAPTPAS